MSKTRNNAVYAFVASVARLVPDARFYDAESYLRDGTTRINVQVGDKNRLFVVAKMGDMEHKDISSPQEVADHFNKFRSTWVSRGGRCGSKVDVWTGQPPMEVDDDGHPYYRASTGAHIVGSHEAHSLSVDELGYGECRALPND